MATILLVEDDRFLSDTIRDYLQWKEHTVDRAFEGAEALEKMRYGQYDLIILDWQLPGMDGIAACKSYRESGGTTPVLMLTGRSGVEETKKALAAGANGFLPKPFKLDEFDKDVDAFLTKKVTT